LFCASNLTFLFHTILQQPSGRNAGYVHQQRYDGLDLTVSPISEKFRVFDSLSPSSSRLGVSASINTSAEGVFSQNNQTFDDMLRQRNAEELLRHRNEDERYREQMLQHQQLMQNQFQQIQQQHQQLQLRIQQQQEAQQQLPSQSPPPTQENPPSGNT
jgi:hypothetical protein